MSFLNPAFLFATGLVAIPLIIHLIRRRKLKIIQWAAMEFLRQSQKKQKRRLRIEELILLALRMLIVLLFALALARPVLRAMGIPLLSQNSRVYAVIVLDNSFSMAHRGSDGKSSLERAQAGIQEMLAHVLKEGDAVSVVLLSDKPEEAVGAPSYDLKLIGQRVRAVKISDRGTDYFAAAQLADRLLKASRAPMKEVYWFSDDQAGAWESSKKEAARAVWSDIGKQGRVTWVSVGAPAAERDNLAVETPALGRELVTPRQPARIEARIFNYGAKARNDLIVNLSIDGKPAANNRVSVSPGGSTVVRFNPLFPQTGTHTGLISLTDAEHADGLSRDNSAPFVVRCRDHIRILVQDVRPTADPSKSESFYLLTAMAPGGSEESLAPKLREGEGLGNTDLHDYDAVVIAGFSGLSTGDRSVLAEYVKGGGGLLFYPGPDTDPRRVNADLGAAGLLPARLGSRRVLGDNEAITLNPATVAHSALMLFKDTSTVDFSTARFLTYFPLEPSSDDPNPNAVRIMARFSNGDPAFVERQVGLGHVILAASSAGTSGNDMPLKASSYVPLVNQLLAYLGQGAVSRRNLQQDEALFLSLPLTDANKPVRVTDPDNRVVSQNSVLDARGVTFSYAATHRAGLYRVAVPGTATADAFAVGLPASESNLAYADPGVAAQQAGLPKDHLTLVNTPAQLQAAVNRARYGAEFWRWLIGPILCLLFLESFLAQYFGRRG